MGAHKTTVIFDMDGTLVDSWDAMQKTLDEYCEQHNIAKADIGSFMRSVSSQYGGVSEWADYPEATYHQLTQDYFSYLNEHAGKPGYLPTVYTGVIEGLSLLTQLGYQLAVFTSNEPDVVSRTLEHCGLSPYFTAVFSAADVRRLGIKGKPSAAIFTEIVAQLQPDLQHTYYVGDSLNDLLFAKNAGIQGIFAAYGYTDSNFIHDFYPQPITILSQATDISRLPDLLI